MLNTLYALSDLNFTTVLYKKIGISCSLISLTKFVKEDANVAISLVKSVLGHFLRAFLDKGSNIGPNGYYLNAGTC